MKHLLFYIAAVSTSLISANTAFAIDCGADSSCGENCCYHMEGGVAIIKEGSSTIPGRAFYGRQDITDVMIPDSVTSIGYRAFNGTQLTDVTIPDSVTSIGDFAFYNMPTLQNVDIKGTGVSLGDRPFGVLNANIQHTGTLIWSCGTDCTATLDPSGHVDFKGTGEIGGIQIGLRSLVTSVTIPEGTTKIGQSAFQGTQLTDVTIPDSVTSIGDFAFYAGPTLSNIVIPDSVTSIGERAFQGTQLTNVTIPDSVTNISDLAFYNIRTLTSLVLPDSIISIGDRAFGNTALTEIFCSKASVESGKCASLASAGNANVSKINFGYYKDDAMNDERVFYLKDENGVWQEAKRESIYEKYIADTGAVYLYDSKGNLKKMRGKKIYTIEEAEEATKNGNSFHVGLTYK